MKVYSNYSISTVILTCGMCVTTASFSNCDKIDLNLSKSADPATLYVAVSRFLKADDVLILQPFSIEVFQQGVPDQPACC